MSSAGSLYRRYAHVGRQFIKFGLVGGAGVVVNMLVAIVMNKLNGGTANAQRILFSVPGTPFNVRYTTFVWVGAFIVAVVAGFLAIGALSGDKGEKKADKCSSATLQSMGLDRK